MKSLGVLILFLFVFSFGYAQITDNTLDFRLRNDDAGEISNLLHTGDDLGETHGLRISANLLNADSAYNFRVKIESIEYAVLHEITPDPRDILFTELNDFQLAIDNNKFENNSYFSSGTVGVYYISGKRSKIGATGQKHAWHNRFINKVWADKYWQYVDSPVKDRYIPYVELKYGYTRFLFKKSHASLITVTNLEGRLAGDFTFTGIGARSYLDYKISNDRYKMHALDFELEGYYMTNGMHNQTAYLQSGIRLNFKHLAMYMQLNKPIKKYIDNPLIKYDDMELLFNYGLALIF